MNQWKYVKLGEVCTIERGGSPRPIDDFITTDENGINWIKIGDADESMYITKTAQRIKPEGMKKSRYVKPGDFLLSNSMSFGRPYILKIDGCIHDGWLVLRDENNVFDKKFLYYYLSAPITYKKFKSMAVGGVVNNLNSDMVRKVRVPMPSQEEQHQISDRLDRVSNLIFLRKQQLAKLDELVKARFVEMFGDPSNNPMGWKKQNFEDIALLITDGEHMTPQRTNKGIYLLSARNILNHTIQLDDVDYIDEEEYGRIARRIVPQQGDVLVSCSGSIGRCCVVPSELKFQMVRSVALIRFNNTINPIFAEWLIATDELQKQIYTSATQSSQANLFQGKIRKLCGYVPPLSLQNQFAAFVERVDKQKQTVQQSLEKLKLMKKALMQEYFG